MLRLSKKEKEELEKLGVGLIYLYGSMVEGIDNAGSDYDLGVVLVKPQSNYYTIYPDLYLLLTMEIPKSKEVDISFLDFSPPSFQFEVIKKGQVIYKISPQFQSDFEEKITRNYLDFKPFLEEYNRVTLEAFK